MKKMSPSGRSSGGMQGSDLHKGLSNSSPKAVDGSTRMGGESVAKDAVRDGVAKQPRELGPRTA